MCANITYYLMQKSFLHLPLSLSIIIFQTNPFWTAILSRLINDETVFLFEIVGMILSFLGICILGGVSYMEQKNKKMEGNNNQNSLLGVVLMMTASILFSVVCVVNRKLKDINPGVIVAFHGSISTLTAMTLIIIEVMFEGH